MYHLFAYEHGTANRGLDDVGGVDLRMTTVADKLSAAGYVTHQAGKWCVPSSGDRASLPAMSKSNSFRIAGMQGVHALVTFRSTVDLIRLWATLQVGHHCFFPRSQR